MEQYPDNLSNSGRMKLFDDLKHTMRKLEGLLEVFILASIYYYVWKKYYRLLESVHNYYGNGKFLLVGMYALLVFFLFLYCDSFKYGHLKLIDVLISQWTSLIIANFMTYFQICLIANHMVNVVPILVLTGIDVIVALIFTYLYTAIYHRVYVPRRMVMIYGMDSALTLKGKMDTRNDKYRVIRSIPESNGCKQICSELKNYDAVILNDVSAEMRNDILKFCYENEIRTYMVPKISDIIIKGAEEITLFDTPLLLIKGRGLTLAQKLAKRIMDVLLCSIAMVPGAVIMLVVAAAIKIEDRGPVFYQQERLTKDGKKFQILKFRSMIVGAEKDGRSIPATDRDPRITRVGRVIRATRLDEFPQILNILKGDMSIVGPRPERVEHVEKYMKEIPEFKFRMKVKGGLTGYAQIYGKYNTSAYDKLRLDLMYIENYSLFLDIKLILMTIQTMFKKESTEGFTNQQNDMLFEKVAVTVEEKIDKK